MRKIRIARNPVSFTNAIFRLWRLVNVFLKIHQRHIQEGTRDYVTTVRMIKVQKDTEVSEMRRQKLCNDLVIQDLRIEMLKQKLGIQDGQFTDFKD